MNQNNSLAQSNSKSAGTRKLMVGASMLLALIAMTVPLLFNNSPSRAIIYVGRCD